jgi:biopolymer transport protein ExbD
MHGSGFSLGTTGADTLMSRRPSREQPEFDITAMVDLVFMMNIYFLVTFVGAAALNLPAAKFVTALDADEAVIFTVTRSLDGKGATLYVGDSTDGEPITDETEQAQRIQAAVEQGVAEGKKYALMKAERKVRMADFFRIASLAVAPVGDSGTRLTLHDAVMEKDE